MPNYPRKTRLAAVSDPDSGMPKLTSKQELFCLGLLEGLSAKESYRRAFDCTKSSEATISADSSKLARDPKIALYIRCHQRIGLQAAGITRESHLAELARMRELAIENTQISAGVQAEHYRGRVAGLYNDKLALTIGPSDEALLSQLQALLGPEIAKAIAEGLEPSPAPVALLSRPSPLDESEGE